MEKISIKFIRQNGDVTDVKVKPGLSLMEAAVHSDISEIEAKCFGNCCCVTCHVWIAPDWITTFPEMSEMEESMLDFGEAVDKRSRLSCQVNLGPEHSGLVVNIPDKQRVIGL